jgi:hypothetical protein
MPASLQVFYENEIVPLQGLFETFNEWAGMDIVRFALDEQRNPPIHPSISRAPRRPCACHRTPSRQSHARAKAANPGPPGPFHP